MPPMLYAEGIYIKYFSYNYREYVMEKAVSLQNQNDNQQSL